MATWHHETHLEGEAPGHSETETGAGGGHVAVEESFLLCRRESVMLCDISP